MNSVPLFVIVSAVIVSMYGGGFATVPAYLRDLFGTMEVGAIHGRLLTAWSAAGIFGPVLVNYIREYEKNHGVPLADSYSSVFYVMVGLLIVGLLANAAVRPVGSRYWYKADEVGNVDWHGLNRIERSFAGQLAAEGAEHGRSSEEDACGARFSGMAACRGSVGLGSGPALEKREKLFQSPPAATAPVAPGGAAPPAAK